MPTIFTNEGDVIVDPPKQFPDRCPKCGSEEVEGSGVEISRSDARQECWCLKCDGEWIAVFTFSHNIFVDREGGSS